MHFISLFIAIIIALLSCQTKNTKQIEYLSSSKSSVIFTLDTKANKEAWINIKSSFSLEPEVIRLDKLHNIDSAINITGQITFSLGEIGNTAYNFEYFAFPGDTVNITYDSRGIPFVNIHSLVNRHEVLNNLYYNINKSAIGINSLIDQELSNLISGKTIVLPTPQRAVSNNLQFIDSLYSKGLIDKNTKALLDLRQYGFLSSYFIFKKDYKAFKYTFKEKLLPNTKLIDSAIFFKELFVSYIKVLDGINADKDQFDYKKLAYNTYSGFSIQLTDYLYYYLAAKSKSYQPKDYKELKQIFLSKCKDSLLKQQFLASEIPQVKISDNTSDILFDIHTKEIRFDSLITKFKGKIIYIDFWASWCAPCIAEMPKSKELRDKYANKDVVFIFISIDNNLKAWLNSQNRLISNDSTLSFLFADPQNSRILKLVKLNSVPRYLIFDKSGKLTNSNAPSPTEILKTNIIEQLLDD